MTGAPSAETITPKNWSGKRVSRIDYAIASIQQASYAVLDAVAGRVEVEQAKRA